MNFYVSQRPTVEGILQIPHVHDDINYCDRHRTASDQNILDFQIISNSSMRFR